MECLDCQGTMKRETAPVHGDRTGDHLTFDPVPAWVCGQCGEVPCEDPELEALQEIIQTRAQQTPETPLVPA